MRARAQLAFVVAAALAFAAVPACAGAPAFQPGFHEYREPEFSEVVSTLQRSAAREEQSVAIGLTPAPNQEIYAWDLATGRMLWTTPLEGEIRTAPVAAGSTVIVQQGDEVVVRALASGQEVQRVEVEGAILLGADGVGDLVVLSMRTGTERTPHGHLVALRGDSRLWEKDVDLPVGVPAVVGELVLVPWGTQRVTVLDASTGLERARLRIRDDVVGQAFVDRGSVYFGQHGIFRVTPSVQSGSKRTSAYFAPRGRHLPGQPLFLRDGYEPLPAPDSALHKVRLAWRAAGEGETVRLEDDNMYLVFYRYVFALAPDADTLRWVYVGPADIVGVQAEPGGLLVADDRGELAFITAQAGQRAWTQDAHRPAMAIHLRAAGFTPPAATALPEAPPAIERLFEAATLDDQRLSGGRAFAIEHMARTASAEVTAHLVFICSDANAPDPVRAVACGAVGERTDGGDSVLAALATRASFVDGTPAPPVGALARAAARMGLRRSVPDLIAHLEHPATRPEDLGPLLSALGTFRAQNAARAVERFLLLYHADPSDAHVVEALGVATETLATIRGRAAEPLLRRIIDDPMSPAGVRARATQTLTALTEPAHPTAPTAPVVAPVVEAQPDTRVPQLTQAIVDQVLAPAARQLQRCVDRAESPPPSARVVMVVASDGELESVSILPTTVAPCIEPLVRERRFPASRVENRQRVNYTIRRGTTRAPPAVVTPPPVRPTRVVRGDPFAGDGDVRPPPIRRPPTADGGVPRPRPPRPTLDGGVPRPRPPRPTLDGGVPRPRPRLDGSVPRPRPPRVDGSVPRPRPRPLLDGGVPRPRRARDAGP